MKQRSTTPDMAKSYRREGGQLCKNGDPSFGITKLEQAPNQINVAPTK